MPGSALSEPAVSPAYGLLRAFADAGGTHFTGVPCSLLKGVFRLLEQQPADSPIHYLPAPREDSALGTAVGLAVAGARPVVLMQNSGLGYCLNVLTSLCLVYDVHVPLVVSWRGHGPDAVEHEVIGRELPRLLDVFDLPWTVFDPAAPAASVDKALAAGGAGQRTPVLIVKEGI
ncbi:MAG TPA: thiamine pyrophosphate-binding protein [Actinospica sp.]|jgi:phosphonopyruvate decarboxylase|nr:thiamine pyrophosphate-binding protein [Actinospica sp.]